LRGIIFEPPSGCYPGEVMAAAGGKDEKFMLLLGLKKAADE
jgi:hypothetical protein